VATDTDVALSGAIDGRTIAASNGATAVAQLAHGSHGVSLRLDLKGRNWRFVPLWNGADVFSAGVTTFTPVTGVARALHRFGRWVAPALVVVLLASWIGSALATYWA